MWMGRVISASKIAHDITREKQLEQMRFLYSSVFFLSSSACLAQPVTFGVKGGIRTTDDISSNGLFGTASESKRYVVGPMFEVGLPFGLAVEVDALYRREGYRTTFSNFAGSSFSRETANSWEFPLLLKYKLPLPVAKPYVVAGYAPQVINGQMDSNGYSIDVGTGQQTFFSSRMSTNWDVSHGLVVGGGIQLGIGALRLSPEVRYTYWNNPAINVFGIQGYRFQSAQNQVDVLVGIGWKVH
jgi:hypothetical protein